MCVCGVSRCVLWVLWFVGESAAVGEVCRLVLGGGWCVSEVVVRWWCWIGDSTMVGAVCQRFYDGGCCVSEILRWWVLCVRGMCDGVLLDRRIVAGTGLVLAMTRWWVMWVRGVSAVGVGGWREVGWGVAPVADDGGVVAAGQDA